MKWQDKLTKKELKHLRNFCGVRSLAAAKIMFKNQAIMRLKADKEGIPPGMGEPCWECLDIARKLGFR